MCVLRCGGDFLGLGESGETVVRAGLFGGVACIKLLHGGYLE